MYVIKVSIKTLNFMIRNNRYPVDKIAQIFFITHCEIKICNMLKN